MPVTKFQVFGYSSLCCLISFQQLFYHGTLLWVQIANNYEHIISSNVQSTPRLMPYHLACRHIPLGHSRPTTPPSSPQHRVYRTVTAHAASPVAMFPCVGTRKNRNTVSRVEGDCLIWGSRDFFISQRNTRSK